MESWPDVRRKGGFRNLLSDGAEEVIVEDDGHKPDDAPPEGSEGSDDFNRRLADFERSDIGNARRMRRRFGADMAHVPGRGWMVWDGARFAADAGAGDAGAVKRAHWTVALLGSREVKALRDEGPPPPSAIEEEEKDPVKAMMKADRLKKFEERVEALRRFAVTSGNASKVNGMLEMATPYLHREPSAMDADPWLFNTRTGTIPLDRREAATRIRAARKVTAGEGCSDDDPPPDWAARAAERADLITRLAGAGFDPAAEAPRFLAFIERILPEPAVRRFVQRLLGSCLV